MKPFLAFLWGAASVAFLTLLLQALWFTLLGAGTVRVSGNQQGFSEGIEAMQVAAQGVYF